MSDARRTPRPRAAALLAVLGGVTGVTGALMTWVSVETGLFGGTRSASARGVAGTGGKLAVGAGVVLAVAGLTAMLARAPRARHAAMIVGLLAAVALGTVAVANLVTIERAEIDELIRARGGDPATLAPESRAAFERSYSVSKEPGLYVTAAGGVIGALAAAAGSRADHRRRSDAPPAAPEPHEPR